MAYMARASPNSPGYSSFRAGGVELDGILTHEAPVARYSLAVENGPSSPGIAPISKVLSSFSTIVPIFGKQMEDN